MRCCYFWGALLRMLLLPSGSSHSWNQSDDLTQCNDTAETVSIQRAASQATTHTQLHLLCHCVASQRRETDISKKNPEMFPQLVSGSVCVCCLTGALWVCMCGTSLCIAQAVCPTWCQMSVFSPLMLQYILTATRGSAGPSVWTHSDRFIEHTCSP